MAVKHIEEGEVHKGTKGGTTGCGTDTEENPDHWVPSSLPITCNKNGCRH
jgi:hypothetical protein